MIKLTKFSDESAHQTATEFIKLQTPDQTIQIGFTDQKVSGRAGLLTFADFLHWHRFGELLAGVLPRFKQRRRGYQPFEYALGFLAGILAGAKKLPPVAHLHPTKVSLYLRLLLAKPGFPLGQPPAQVNIGLIFRIKAAAGASHMVVRFPRTLVRVSHGL